MQITLHSYMPQNSSGNITPWSEQKFIGSYIQTSAFLIIKNEDLRHCAKQSKNNSMALTIKCLQTEKRNK